MNYARLFLAALAATVAFFAYGFLVHGWIIAKDYLPYPLGVYCPSDDSKSHMPFGLLGLFVAILIFTVIYARGFAARPSARAGARLGFLFGIFMAGAFVAVNYATIHISGKLASELAVSELLEWSLVGLVVGLIYKPPAIS